jgi:hypothetical protein
MPGGFKNRPKILRGAFVEYGLSIPPLFVVFQFNPVQLSRNRSQYFSVPTSAQQASGEYVALRDYHKRFDDLIALRDAQHVHVEPESLNFEIRLDATDALEEGNGIAQEFGIAPRLATLELMLHPKGEGLLGGLVDDLLGLDSSGFSFSKTPNPPLILFIWGRQRVLPVNITNLSITETEFDTQLNPTRATASVSLTVIEGPNIPFTYSKAFKEVTSALNLANIGEIADVIVPS